VNENAPASSAVTITDTMLSTRTATVAPGSAVPVTVGVVDVLTPPEGESPVGARGTPVSTTKLQVSSAPTLPAVSAPRTTSV
jgi:hypothetical protein